MSIDEIREAFPRIPAGMNTKSTLVFLAERGLVYRTDADDEDDEDPSCAFCAGTGEGQYDGQSCSYCKGKCY